MCRYEETIRLCSNTRCSHEVHGERTTTWTWYCDENQRALDINPAALPVTCKNAERVGKSYIRSIHACRGCTNAAEAEEERKEKSSTRFGRPRKREAPDSRDSAPFWPETATSSTSRPLPNNRADAVDIIDDEDDGGQDDTQDGGQRRRVARGMGEFPEGGVSHEYSINDRFFMKK